MELVYLSNGQACYLKEQIGNKYVVTKIFEYEDQEYGWQEIEDTNDILVDAVFKNKPIQKIDDEIKTLQAKKKEELNNISVLEKQKKTLEYEIDKITKTQITNGKFIVNRTELLNATTLALFVKDRIMPITLTNTEKSFRGLKLSLTIELSSGIERSWGYNLYYENIYEGGDYLCEKYGILINPTQDEIDATIRKRILEFKFSDYWLKTVDDKYLTPDLIIQKTAIIRSEKEKKRDDLEKLLKETQEKLSSLYGNSQCDC